MKLRYGKIAIATTTFALATLLSVDWSAQGGVSLSVESAQARVGRPLTPVSVAGVARRQYRRSTYGYGAGVVGAGLAAGAVAAAATSPYGYYGQGYDGYANRSYVTGRPTLLPRYYGQPYGYQAAGYAGDPNAAYASTYPGNAGGYYAESPWGYHECTPGTSLWDCQPYAHTGWYHY